MCFFYLNLTLTQNYHIIRKTLFVNLYKFPTPNRMHYSLHFIYMSKDLGRLFGTVRQALCLVHGRRPMAWVLHGQLGPTPDRTASVHQAKGNATFFFWECMVLIWLWLLFIWVRICCLSRGQIVCLSVLDRLIFRSDDLDGGISWLLNFVPVSYLAEQINTPNMLQNRNFICMGLYWGDIYLTQNKKMNRCGLL